MSPTIRRGLLYVQLALWAPLSLGVALLFPLMLLLSMGSNFVAFFLAVLATGSGVLSTWVIAIAFVRGRSLGWPLYSEAPWVLASVGLTAALLFALWWEAQPQDHKGLIAYFYAALPGWLPLGQLGYEAWRESR